MFQVLPRPSRSTLHCGAAALVTVLLMTWVRPLGVLFLGLLGYWIYWTRCSFRVVPTDELRGKINTWLQRIDDWRHGSPSMFCLASSGCLGTLAVLGHLISGSTLVLTILVVSALVSTKYNFKLLKIEHRDFQWSEKLNYNNLEAEGEDEFLPDVNESNLFVLERASDVATISSPTEANDEDDDERSDDIPSELLIPDVIPEIDEHSTDEDDELAPLATKRQEKPQQQQQQEQLAREGEDMNFRKGHFKRDSSLSTTSSSSEESLSKGLQFPDHSTVDASGNPQLRQITAGPDPAGELVALAVKTQAQALLANSGKLLPSLVSGLVQWGVGGAAAVGAIGDDTDASRDRDQQRIVTALDSSDESDFEILESDDFK
ncbi:uncharacterized protein LOC6549694 [Drosophila erecta]|uniref:Uncharacterized protein n=1 Tax=Drosophila erecta TaxID=7220 RepID=B3NY69_DROER|nr:uncharacterized protein LOC6549694 [Drosophila erecta]XP_026837634.1 uncharacterized protein LOC6549694 [Drosophila erecta]XP_026837635.1 uncharacterized protein LOC6549694 [Drosophila erecta]XP_026837636.1 uncharacterized protein LOC6549694 [Drosophila erecta]XP_026837637.1 uncharacterized protein LOC6549694 [Drosophila erecta]XP_026837638.1 uncharacterized protein LOC6549694 [Drosophila erecta]XP_026837639.1 uncharacterized protein LOC6549694 [Drosophila erecta]EDV47654.1 uncharacterize